MAQDRYSIHSFVKSQRMDNNGIDFAVSLNTIHGELEKYFYTLLIRRAMNRPTTNVPALRVGVNTIVNKIDIGMEVRHAI